MRAHWLKLFFFLTFFLFCTTLSNAEPKELLTRKGAVIIAEATKEVKGLYSLLNGELRNCIQTKVVEPCNAHWSSCIHDVWVVQFEVSDVCGIHHDGRLGITFLIDAHTGEIISRYPESPYFENARYCQGDQDCVCVPSNVTKTDSCLNFIHGQLSKEKHSSCLACSCQNDFCAPAP